MKSSLEIAQEAVLRPIMDVATEMGLEEDEVDLYGKYKAKIDLSVIDRLSGAPDAKIVCVSAITPTKAGEGKTTTSVSLTQGLGAIGKRPILCLREPSLGPIFGIKGGAAGGGLTQVVPMEDLNLHFTGDFHAIAAANNMLAAFVDRHIFYGNDLKIDPFRVSWRRAVDMNDRHLRNIITGLGGATHGIPRETGFDIVAASEVMAIMGMATSLQDLRKRIGSITVAYDVEGAPVTAEQMGCAGAMTVLLKDALKPNLIQTLEGQPCFMHIGPFGNIAHGNSSVVADLAGRKLGDYLVTEAGFGSDLGMEKFMDIVCRAGGFGPNAVVIVATAKALKHHAGLEDDPRNSAADNLRAIEEGSANLASHILNAKEFGVPCVVAANRFPGDTDEEVALVQKLALDHGALRGGAERGLLQGRRRCGRDGRGRGRCLRPAEHVQLHVRGLRPDRRQDREDREAHLPGGGRRLPAGRAAEDRAVHARRADRALDLHGQDAPVAVGRSGRWRTHRPASAFRCATSGPTPAPGS